MSSRNRTLVRLPLTTLVISALGAFSLLLSDAGISFAQRLFSPNPGKEHYGQLSVQFDRNWILETVARRGDGELKWFGLFPSGKRVSPTDLMMVLRGVDTEQRLTVQISPAASGGRDLSQFNECVKNGTCRETAQFLGFSTPATIVAVPGGEWAYLPKYSVVILAVGVAQGARAGVGLVAEVEPQRQEIR